MTEPFGWLRIELINNMKSIHNWINENLEDKLGS